MKKAFTFLAAFLCGMVSLFGQNGNLMEIKDIFASVNDEKNIQVLEENNFEEVSKVKNIDLVEDFVTLSEVQTAYLIYANTGVLKSLFKNWNLSFYVYRDSYIEVNGMKLTKVLIFGKSFDGVGKGFFAYMNLDKDFQAAHTYVFASDRVFTVFDKNGKPYLITQYNKSLYIFPQGDLEIEYAMMYCVGYRVYVVYMDKINKEVMCVNMTAGTCTAIYSVKEYENPKLMWGVGDRDFQKYNSYMFTNPETDNYVSSDFNVDSTGRFIRGPDDTIFINDMYIVDLDSRGKIKDNVVNLHQYIK